MLKPSVPLILPTSDLVYAGSVTKTLVRATSVDAGAGISDEGVVRVWPSARKCCRMIAEELGGGRQSLRSGNWMLGTCSGIRDILVGDNLAGRG